MPSEWPYTGDACILIERDSIGAVDHDVWTLSGEGEGYICEAKRRWEGTISQGHMTDRLSATYAEPLRICVVDSHGAPAELPATKWTISDDETSEVVEFVDEGEQAIYGTGTVRVYTTESLIFTGSWSIYTDPVDQKVPCTSPCAYGLAHYCDPGDVPATVTDLEAKQNVLTAGDNVSIVDDVISVPLDSGDGIGLDTSEDVPCLYVKLAEENPGLDFDEAGGLKAVAGGGGGMEQVLADGQTELQSRLSGEITCVVGTVDATAWMIVGPHAESEVPVYVHGNFYSDGRIIEATPCETYGSSDVIHYPMGTGTINIAQRITPKQTSGSATLYMYIPEDGEGGVPFNFIVPALIRCPRCVVPVEVTVNGATKDGWAEIMASTVEGYVCSLGDAEYPDLGVRSEFKPDVKCIYMEEALSVQADDIVEIAFKGEEPWANDSTADFNIVCIGAGIVGYNILMSYA